MSDSKFLFKINQGGGYLAGLLITIQIFLLGQLFFAIGTSSAVGRICDITEKTSVGRYRGRVEIYFACFTTTDGSQIRLRVGSNLGYELEDKVSVIYKKNNPTKARLDRFSEFWLIPSFPYIIVLAIIMGLVKALYVKKKYLVIETKPVRMYME
ncbi:MAG: hypothetical protein H7Y42_00735 [Chitinophagaceae bacterium]|nr:hypothetical protein [Chitinophagaceae bacterium]